LGSSSLNEKSLSYGYDPLLNQPKSDEFTFYLDQFLKEGPSREDASIKDLWAYLDFAKLKVHSKLAPSSRRNSRRKLSEFMFKQMRIGERRGTLRLPAALRDM
jgi:glycosylphosphatidylinositol transamidase (GPIT) subunit GPI8